MKARLSALFTLLPLAAAAQASVTAEVREANGAPAEGRVTLTADQGGGAYTCETRGGSCSISGVPGGRYVLRFDPRIGGEPPAARVVVIPPGGAVTLRVSAH